MARLNFNRIISGIINESQKTKKLIFTESQFQAGGQFYLYGRNYSEIAKAMGISENQVKKDLVGFDRRVMALVLQSPHLLSQNKALKAEIALS